MKLHGIILLVLIFSFSAFAQKDEFYTARRVHWLPDGQYELHNFSDKEKATLKVETDHFIRDGVIIRTTKVNDFYFYLSLTYDSAYFYANLFVFNGSKVRALVDPAQSAILTYKTQAEDEVPEMLLPIPPEKIAAQIRSRAQWANFFSALGAGLATTTATFNVGGTTGTVTVPNVQAQRTAAAQNSARILAAYEASDRVMERALKANTLFENQSAGGSIYFKKKKKLDGGFLIKVGNVYMSWDVYKEK